MKNATLAQPASSLLQKALNRLRELFLGTPEARYLAAMKKKLAAGAKHSTLGPLIRDEAYTRGKAEDWAKRMIDYGLKEDHLCVEFGCGSLWAAEPIVRFLQPGRYIGLDLTDEFYEYGRQRLGDLLREKQVRLAVIGEAKLREVAALQPDFLFSRKVLPHVAEDALQRYLANVASLMTPKTIAVLDNTPMFTEDGKITGRRHSVEAMQKLLPPGYVIEQSRYAAILRRTA
ncbi:methyltransferase [Dongia sedimenti]|uniref:Class I SAM-dependent methyltransferase n=1 Tax=Dongia sedimenti TaxID=3064282 RepID=A0ABU0YN75_9PROT|nr:class I SAM-dependent methyltransferase [Rhodospirillaceae bacterium R-7]